MKKILNGKSKQAKLVSNFAHFNQQIRLFCFHCNTVKKTVRM